jgi:hypothetical protein
MTKTLPNVPWWHPMSPNIFFMLFNTFNVA